MSSELPFARRDAISARLEQGQPVIAATLAAEYSVSEDAIRRDLRALAAEGRCRRVYGGALPVSMATQPMSVRMEEGQERKLRLARAAAPVVQPGELVFLDSGSTNLALLETLPEDAGLTIVTNAVEIAAAALRRQDVQLIVIGGAADPIVGGCVDAAAAQAVASMKLDRAFIGACSVSIADGVSAFRFADAVFKRVVLSVARHKVVLATAEKLIEAAPHRVALLSEINLLVIEPGTAMDQRAALEAAGCKVLIAG